MEGTWEGWGNVDLRWWRCAFEQRTRGRRLGPNSETELPGLHFSERTAGGSYFNGENMGGVGERRFEVVEARQLRF